MNVDQAGGDQTSGARYAAFISYSHKDAVFGRWLHRRLEGYRLPRRLAGSDGERGLVPARLTPIFRDREELPAAGDLSERVRAALAMSGSLIVVCSPNAAASPWVAKEIETFRQLHSDRPIFAAIVAGEPGQCFPPALRHVHGGEIEPLAADFRKDSDGRRLGLLKLVAGIAGIGLDQLVQRDAQRRIRRVTAVTLAAIIGMLVTATMAIVAINARAEAQRQRREAEGLVEFMRTGLRAELKKVGRLDVLTAVNQHALAYYQRQNISRLPPDSLERRARILHAMGEDNESRGKFQEALAQFQEAARTTKALLNSDPTAPDRIFAHAQSEYWLGYAAYRGKDWLQARNHWTTYKRYADQLIRSQPGKPEWLRESGYADGNLCTLDLDSHGSPTSALRHCRTALSTMIEVRDKLPDDAQSTLDLVNRYAWIADAYNATGDLSRGQVARDRQLRLLAPMAIAHPNDSALQDQWMRTLMIIAESFRNKNRRSEANIYHRQAEILASRLVARDPSNHTWRKWKERIMHF